MFWPGVAIFHRDKAKTVPYRHDFSGYPSPGRQSVYDCYDKLQLIVA